MLAGMLTVGVVLVVVAAEEVVAVLGLVHRWAVVGREGVAEAGDGPTVEVT